MTNAEKDLIDSMGELIADVQLHANEMECILNDLNNEYFARFDPNRKSDFPSIIDDFKENADRADIALDTFLYMLGCIDAIEIRINKAKEQMKQEEGEGTGKDAVHDD